MMAVRPDLYWYWADATGYLHTRVGTQGDTWWVQLLLELNCHDEPDSAQRLHDFLQGSRNSTKHGFVPKPYRITGVRFCTAWVERSQISELPADFVLRFKMGIACLPSQKIIDIFHETEGGGSNWSKEKISEPCVLAVIDDYVNLGHPSFGGRIKTYWDQSDNSASANVRPNFGYKYLLDDTRAWVDRKGLRAVSHGTHVASLCGGRQTPQHRMRYSTPNFNGAAPLDAASDVPMAVVMLPDLTVADTSGGALGVNVLDALTFLLSNIDSAAHVVVNLSFGSTGGPHDGTSILESAIQDLIDRPQRKLTVVLPSGNSFEAQCHAQYVIPAGHPQELTWRVLPDDSTPSFLEIWLPKGADVAVDVIAPNGVRRATKVLRNQNFVWPEGGVVSGGIWRSDEPANGNNRHLTLIALAPTSGVSLVAAARHGDWTVLIRNTGSEEVSADVWVERDNATFGRRSEGRQSYLVDSNARRRIDWPPLSAATGGAVTGLGSMSGIATGEDSVVVGAYTLSTGEVASYSGAGSANGGIACPDIVAPGDESLVLQGIPGAANTECGTARLRGTSVAAPLVARGLVNTVISTGGLPPKQSGLRTPANGFDARKGVGVYSL